MVTPLVSVAVQLRVFEPRRFSLKIKCHRLVFTPRRIPKRRQVAALQTLRREVVVAASPALANAITESWKRLPPDVRKGRGIPLSPHVGVALLRRAERSAHVL